MDEKEKKMQETVFFIEANSFETHTLWREHHKKDAIWDEDRMGFTQVIGCIGGDKEKPVNVSFMFAIINGSRVCFYDVCSRFNDSEMVENWIEANYPRRWDNGRRRAMTNAQNFHHAIDHCRTLAQIGKPVTDAGK